ncbi:MAG: hypothetical protein ACRD2E_04180 [Terriglobales bacterium]
MASQAGGTGGIAAAAMLAALGLLTFGAARLAAQAPAGVAAPVRVRVQTARVGRRIPRNFAGFSIEVDAAARDYFGPADAPNRVFFQLMRDLGGGTVRIGGNSTDDSCWRPQAAPRPQGCHFTITRADVRGFARASAATGWGLFVGVNLAQNDPHWAATYGRAVARAMRARPKATLLGFEFGNEPDLFSRHRLYDDVTARPQGFSVADLVRDWHAYAAAFHAQPATVAVPIVGPAMCCQWLGHGAAGLQEFLAAVGHQDLSQVTVHNYPLTHCGGQHPTIAQLLAPGLLTRYAKTARGWVRIARQAGYPIRYGEGNSVSCEGENGVSNAFAATAWGVDWLFLNARAGMRGVNFHEGGEVISLGYHGRHYYYDAVRVDPQMAGGKVAYHNHVWPLYYAMYAFAKNAEGRRLLTTRVRGAAPGPAPVTAYAVERGRRGPVTVFVVNHDLDAAVPVTVAAPGVAAARLLMVAAPSDASRDVTYGGVKFSPRTGKLAGRPQWHRLRRQGRVFRFILPQAAVAILKTGSN